MLAADDTMEAGGIELNKAAHEVLIDGKSVELSYMNLNCWLISCPIRGGLVQRAYSEQCMEL